MGQARRRPGSVYAVMAAASTFVLAGSMLQPVYPLYVRGLGATPMQFGLLFSLRQFLPLVLRIPLSIAGERVGRIRMLYAGLLVACTSALMYAYASSYTHLLLIVVYEALAAGSFNQVAMSTVSDAAPRKSQGDAMGRYLTFLGLGMLLGPALCSILVVRLSYYQLFIMSGAFPVAGMMVLGLWAPRLPQSTRVESEEPEIGAIDSLRMILSDRNVRLLSYCRLSFATAQSLFLTLFSLYAVDTLGISESMVALMFTIRGLANTLVRFPAGRLSDRIGRKKPMIAAYGLLVVAYLMTALTRDVTLIAAALAIYGFSWGARAVSEWAFLTDLVDPEIKTLSISYLSSVFGLGSTVGSIVAGVLSASMPYSTIFLIAAAMMVPPIPAILSMKKEER